MIRLVDLVPILKSSSANVLYDNSFTNNSYVTSIKFNKISGPPKLKYDIIISTTNEIPNYVSNIINFDDINVVCASTNTLIIPVDSVDNSCKWECSIDEHFKTQAVIKIVPIFMQEYTIIQVILSDKK